MGNYKAVVLTVMLGLNSSIVTATDYVTIGTGSYNYLLWHIYDAKLASKDGSFTDYNKSAPLQLELTYQRDVTKQRFIEVTVDQWQKLNNTSSEQQQEWAKKLADIWLDIKTGDQLAAVLTEQGSVTFLFNQQEIGTIVDVEFGPAFFDIWLSPNTSAKKLRRQLLTTQ